MKTNLGHGVLTWDKFERVSDRYGTVYLMENGRNSFRGGPSIVDEEAAQSLSGKSGSLFAEVTATRKSTHVGDFARSIFPETPEVGERILLGTGTFFTEPCYDGGVCVGLRPDTPKQRDNNNTMEAFHNEEEDYLQIKNPGRTSDWLNPRALYRAHEQTVTLVFESV